MGVNYSVVSGGRCKVVDYVLLCVGMVLVYMVLLLLVLVLLYDVVLVFISLCYWLGVGSLRW